MTHSLSVCPAIVGSMFGYCTEMAKWKGHVFGGVDGQNLPEDYLLPTLRPKGAQDYSSAKLQARCGQLGMDCSDLVFGQACLSPKTIIVEDEPRSGKIGLIGFEVAGYFPRTWIRTKCRVSAAMRLPPEAADDKSWFARKVSEGLGKKGFDDVAEAFWKFLRSLKRSESKSVHHLPEHPPT